MVFIEYDTEGNMVCHSKNVNVIKNIMSILLMNF